MKDTKKIFEYVIPITDESELQLPAGVKKANNTSEVKEALDLAMKGKDYFNCGE